MNIITSEQKNRSPHVPDFLKRRIEGYYRDRVQNTWDGGHIMRGRIPQNDAIHLSSNDYLSLAKHPKILRAISECSLQHGNGLLMSGIFLHGENPQSQLEKKFSEWMGAEAGIICQSGWCANTGLIQSIADEHTPVYLDMFAHMSLWEGVRSAGAIGVMFHHNDLAHLQKQVLKHGPGVIVVDSVYSTNGSLCPLQDIVALATEHNCVLVVDESHSLGTHGKRGEGLVASLGLSNQVHFRTASLAKAFAGRAGLITCSEQFSDYFRFESLPAIFSSTLLPHEIAALDATLDIVQAENWRRENLHINAAYLRLQLNELGYNLNDSQSQIVSLESGTEQQTIILRDALEKRGIFGSIFCAPATPKNRALMRFSLNAALTQSELQKIVQVCDEIRDEVEMEKWPSTRRKRNAISAHAIPHRIQTPHLGLVQSY